ncbi:MAG: large subunit ribosomal protein [Actinomycetota bacterium]|nr:large subunit ribosomal protein [Actinomycetota bacterium]
MARDDKATAVAEIAESLRSSSATVLTEYRGLTVAQLKELRRSLSGNASYSVVKNTLTKIAAREAGVEGIDDLLTGPSALAFVDGDPVEAAKGLRTFAKANPALVIKGGIMDGKVLTAEEVSKLADLESREVLLSKMAGALKASTQNAVSLFAAPLSQAARVVDALRAKVEAEGPPADEAAPAADATDEAAPAVESIKTAEASADAAPEAEASADAEAQG